VLDDVVHRLSRLADELRAIADPFSAVGDQILAPGWTDYRQHVPYQVYDVSQHIKQGNNAIAAYLAPGWYSTPLRWFRQGNNYGNTQPSLRAQLRLKHADGSVDWIVTDEGWKADRSPISQAELYDGETFDARKTQDGWDTANFSDANWHPVMLVTPKEPRIVAQYFPPIRAHGVMTVKTITNPFPGVYVFDFGQNMSAVPRLRVRGLRGDDIKLRFAEVLNSDGTLYVDNLRTAKATDHFILAGSQTGVYPFATPGGWRLIGRTPLTMFRAENAISLLSIGDRVRFVPISPEQFVELENV